MHPFLARMAWGGALGLALAGGALAQPPPRYTLDASGSRVVALSNLSSEPDCVPARATGRVTGRRLDRDGRTLVGITFQDDRSGSSFLNIDPIAPSAPPATRQWVARGMEELFREGQRLTLGLRGCGARGSFRYVDSVALAEAGASAAAGKPSGAAPPGPTAAAPSAAPGSWSFGPHPVLGLSAHVTLGAEAIGLACGHPRYDASRQDFMVLRMTPGLVPNLGADASPFRMFEGGSGSNMGNGSFQRRAGYLENGDRLYCELSDWQRASAAVLVAGYVTSVDSYGLTLRQGDRIFRIRPRSAAPSGLADLVRIPLAGSGQAIRQLLNARQALRQGGAVD